MALRSDGRKLSYDILATSDFDDIMSATDDGDAALRRSHSDPPSLQNGTASSPSRKRKKKKSRKGKSSPIAESAVSETINGDVKYSCTLSTVTEVTTLVPDLDSEAQEVTLPSVYRALRQRNVGNGVNGGSAEVISDDSGSSKKDDMANEEVAENCWTDTGKETGQQGPELNDRKLEKDGTLDWKKLMAEDPNCKLTRSIRFADLRVLGLIYVS